MIVKKIYLIFMILSLLHGHAAAQRWTGTFAWDNQCSTRYCCCYGGSMTLSRSGSELLLTSGTRGCSSSQVSTRFPFPTSTSFTREALRGSQITYMLSSDGNTITARNEGNSRCVGTAKRTSSAIKILLTPVNLALIITSPYLLYAF